VQRRSAAAEQRVRQHAQGADLLYRDAQFLRAEYDGLKGIGSSTAVSRRGWGHSCIEDVIEMAAQCGVRRTLLGHNDPNREWAELNEIDDHLVERRRRCGEWLELARTGMVVDL
jgi:ribonuclease BN (tRNA processing enzyme)